MFLTKHIQKIQIEKKKNELQREVDEVIEMIKYEDSQIKTSTNKKIKSRVYMAYSIAENIYQQNKADKSTAEIQQMIVDALRPISL